GVKDATANLARPSQTRALLGPEFCQLSGEDATALGFMAHGGAGCISVASNVAPRLCAEFQNACMAGDFKKALALQDRLMPLHEVLFIETNPSPVKYAVSRVGFGTADVRLPMVPLSEASRRAIDKVLSDLDLVNAEAAA
ncbi:dihydrodipicolinate synthase family protein, partial [Hyphomicrobium sp.]|uniref:dihydrodipicolinate synthase family protein n=1 Tax=Hyphomicrobium sp. TaxID=82 RepID=UPI0025B95DC3